MRDVLNHKYFDVDLDTVWTTAERDIPALEAKIRRILMTDPAVGDEDTAR
ncbi:MAG: HepT-like ribonuclease domain-containing protein [Gemmatimonadaceae bacterium]